MKLYLSSYRLGNEIAKLKAMTKDGAHRVAYISNALDFTQNIEKRLKHEEIDINLLKDNGFFVEKLDLRDYFGKEADLKTKMNEYDMLWIWWGNCFVLRKAMKLSGLDNILIDFWKNNNELVYWGYSAGVCILGPTLRGLEIVDDPSKIPYSDGSSILYDWLWILDFLIVPHYKSDHEESWLVSEVVDYYIMHKMPFKVLSDWEVLIIE